MRFVSTTLLLQELGRPLLANLHDTDGIERPVHWWIFEASFGHQLSNISTGFGVGIGGLDADADKAVRVVHGSPRVPRHLGIGVVRITASVVPNIQIGTTLNQE